MPLSADAVYDRRGEPVSRNEFAYPVSAGVKVYRGSLVGLKTDGSMAPIGTSGASTFAGMADRTLDNSGSGSVSDENVTALKGTWDIAIGGTVTVANIGATVYATDDATLTMTNSGSLMAVGTLAGIESGKTFLNILGS